MRAPEENVDWSDIRRRVDAAGRALESAGKPSAAESRHILERRARALAVPPTPARADDTIELVTFTIDGETNALPAADVAEVSRFSNYALLPGRRGVVAGVTAWRGELLIVLDLAGSPRPETAPPAWLVVVRDADGKFGLAADAVHGVVDLPFDALHGADSAAPYVRAVTSDSIIVLDTMQLFRLYR